MQCGCMVWCVVLVGVGGTGQYLSLLILKSVIFCFVMSAMCDQTFKRTPDIMTAIKGSQLLSFIALACFNLFGCE